VSVAKLCIVSADQQVASDSELQSAGVAVTSNGSDYRLGHCLYEIQQFCLLMWSGSMLTALDGLEVVASRKRATSAR